MIYRATVRYESFGSANFSRRMSLIRDGGWLIASIWATNSSLAGMSFDLAPFVRGIRG